MKRPITIGTLCAVALLWGAPAFAQQPETVTDQEADQAVEAAIQDEGWEDDTWAEEEPGWGDPFGDEPAEAAGGEHGATDEAAHEATAVGLAAEGAEHGADEHGVDEHGVAEHGAAEAHEGAHGPGAGHEEHGEHHEASITDTDFLATVVNFILWAIIIVVLFRKPLTAFLAGRRREVEEGLEEARRLKEEAEEKYADYSERLERLDEELEKLRQEMIQAGESERDRIIAEAEARAARMRRDAQFIIDQQMKQLRTDLTREAVEAAIAAAEKALVDQIAGGDQQRLADSYLTDISASLKEEEVSA